MLSSGTEAAMAWGRAEKVKSERERNQNRLSWVSKGSVKALVEEEFVLKEMES